MEKILGLLVSVFDNVVKVNNEIKKQDSLEIIEGDHHMKFEKFKTHN